MNANDLFQVTYFGRIAGQVWNWVQWYRVVGTPSTSPVEATWIRFLESLVDESWSTFAASVAGQVSPTFFLDGARGFALDDPTLFGEYTDPTPRQGSGGSDGVGPFTAYGFSIPSRRRGIRPGSHRLAGPIEGAISTDGTLIGACLTALNAFATDYASPQTTNVLGQFNLIVQPVVVKKVFVGIVNGKRRYENPSSSADAEYYDATSMTVDPYLTSQNSRKRGRGI